MARFEERVPENVPGEFYVDRSCIDCDLCRRIAPRTFTDVGTTSAVTRQPDPEDEDAEDTARALMALVACPVSAIGTRHKLDVRAAARRFPEPVTDDVYFCGYASEKSYGAASYLIRRPAGNVLVDSPRAARPLFARMGELGGVARLFLTHRDDVADHAEIAARFGSERILHTDDVTAATRGVERVLSGREPVRLADDLLAIPVPGHTRGSAALLYREEVLFSGDHVWGTPDGKRLSASPEVCWYSWREQRRSLVRLLEHRFRIVLPGHGRPFFAASPEAMATALGVLLARI